MILEYDDMFKTPGHRSPSRCRPADLARRLRNHASRPGLASKTCDNVECPKCGLTFSADDDRDTPVTGCVAEHKGIVADLSRCCLRNSLSRTLGDDVP